MKKGRVFTTGAAALALAAAFAAPGTAAEEPIEELSAIMEAQMEEQESLLEETLGISDFSEAQKENGIWVQGNFGLSKETLLQMGLDTLIPDGGSLNFNTQIDPALKEWLFEIGVGLSEEIPVLELGLYGDEEKLALAVPQFFAGYVSLYAGNFREQYEQSAWVDVAGELPSDIPDIEMNFYPASGTEESSQPTELEEAFAEFTENMQAEKTEEGEETIYKVVCKSEDVMDVYRAVLDKYLALVDGSEMVFSGAEDFEDDLDQMLEEMTSMLGEEIEVLFHVKDDLVEKITYEVEIDTSAFAVEEPDTIMQADESFTGTIDYEIVFADPANALDGMDIRMEVADAAGTEYSQMTMAYRTKTEGTVETTTFNMELMDGSTSIYSGTPFVMSFDAATGDLDMLFSAGEEFAIEFDSTFTEIEQGKSFCWVIDKISMFDGTMEYGLNGEISVSADPGTIEEPKEERELLAMTQGNIVDFVNEIQENIQEWVNQFTPAEERE